MDLISDLFWILQCKISGDEATNVLTVFSKISSPAGPVLSVELSRGLNGTLNSPQRLESHVC